MMKNRKDDFMYKVISCQYGKKAEVLDLEDLKLETLQKLVGGYIEVLPLSDPDENVVLICNEEGWLRNMNANRVVFNSDSGDVLSVIAGDFLILTEKENEDGELDFAGFDDEEILEKYLRQYYYPERILKNSLGVFGIPYEPDLKVDKTKDYDLEKQGPLIESIDVLED